MERYKRIFVIVLDSLGIGEMPDAARFGDYDVDTFGHICDTVGTSKLKETRNAESSSSQRNGRSEKSNGLLC